MRSVRVCSLVLVGGMLLTGCMYPNGQPNQTATGALVGGGLGAATGALVARHRGPGALVGGAIGALAGGMIGQSMDFDAAQRQRLEAQAPRTLERVQQAQPLGLADVKALSQAGVSDDLIISQIMNSHTVYQLTTADIIDLKNSGVSERVIDYMINTPQTAGSMSSAATDESSAAVVYTPPPMPAAPPPMATQTIVVAPGPDFVWLDGYWGWGVGGWAWFGGHWDRPPHPHAFWVHGRWVPEHNHWRWASPHWR